MPKRKRIWLLIFCGIIATGACQQERPQPLPPGEAKSETPSAPADTAAITILTVQEAYQRIQQNPDVVVIDVRTPAEWDGPLGHIPHARLMPVQQIEQWAKEIGEWKEKEIVLVCRSGARSSRAANYLKELGFQRLINVQGGMMAWSQANLPVEKSQ